MNGQLAKKLRRYAEAVTTGKPYRKYKPVKYVVLSGRQLELDRCTRKFYQGLKARQARAA